MSNINRTNNVTGPNNNGQTNNNNNQAEAAQTLQNGRLTQDNNDELEPAPNTAPRLRRLNAEPYPGTRNNTPNSEQP